MLSRRTQQIAVPLKRDDCSSYRTEWAGWASVSHPVAAGPLFLGIAQNGLGCTGLRSRCSGSVIQYSPAHSVRYLKTAVPLQQDEKR